jgi:cobalt/nickel transport system permease protein
VSIGYIIQSLLLEKEFIEYLALFNLRVFDITFLTLYVSSKINLINAVSFSKSLRFLLSATISQIESYKKSYEDFMLALKSRSVKKLKDRKAKEFLSSMFYFFLKKSLHNSKERSLALKARGFFD